MSIWGFAENPMELIQQVRPRKGEGSIPQNSIPHKDESDLHQDDCFDSLS